MSEINAQELHEITKEKKLASYALLFEDMRAAARRGNNSFTITASQVEDCHYLLQYLLDQGFTILYYDIYANNFVAPKHATQDVDDYYSASHYKYCVRW